MKFSFRWFRQKIDSWSESARNATNRLISHKESEETLVDNQSLAAEAQTDPVISEKEESGYSFPVVRFRVVWAVTVIVLYFLRETFSVLTLIFASYIISVAIEWPIRFFLRIWLKRGLSLALCYTWLTVLVLAIMMVIPFVVIQMWELVWLLVWVFQNMQANIIELWWEGFIETRNFLPWAIKTSLLESFRDPSFVTSIQNQLNSLIWTWESWLSNLSVFARKATTWFAQTLWQVSLVVVLAIFFSIEKEWVLRFIVKSFSRRKSDVAHVHERVVTIYSKLQLWLKGQLFLMIYVGLLAYVGFWILYAFGIDIDKKELLAVMAGVTEIIPYLWPLLWAIPALLVATISHGVRWFISVSIVFFVIQRTENTIVVPVVMNKVLGVSALLIFICIILGWRIFGVVWVLLSVPAAVIVAVLNDKNFWKE